MEYKYNWRNMEHELNSFWKSLGPLSDELHWARGSLLSAPPTSKKELKEWCVQGPAALENAAKSRQDQIFRYIQGLKRNADERRYLQHMLIETLKANRHRDKEELEHLCHARS
jgi:hypothetical protein